MEAPLIIHMREYYDLKYWIQYYDITTYMKALSGKHFGEY